MSKQDKPSRHPALAFKEAQDLVLRLPDKYGIYAHNRPKLDGRQNHELRWNARDQDPPPPFRKHYEIEPLLPEEAEDLKRLYANREVLSIAKGLAQAEADLLAKQLADEFTSMVKETKREILDTVRQPIASGQPGNPASTEGKEIEVAPPQASIPSPHPGENTAPTVLPTAHIEEKTIAFSGIPRTMPVNPVMATYYATAIGGGFGERFERDPRQYRMEQFLTEVLVEYFNLYKWRLGVFRSE